MLEHFQDKENYYLVFEFAEKGDLVEIINKVHLSNQQLRSMLFQIISALSHIQKKQVIHRDLKLDNILLNGNNDVKLIDFGISALNEFPKDSQGTPNYISPEALNPNVRSTFKSDLWSFGVIAYILSYKQCPFYSQDKDELYDQILEQNYSIPDYQVYRRPDSFVDLIQNLLLVDTDERLDVKGVLHHEYFKDLQGGAQREYKHDFSNQLVNRSIKIFLENIFGSE